MGTFGVLGPGWLLLMGPLGSGIWGHRTGFRVCFREYHWEAGFIYPSEAGFTPLGDRVLGGV